MVTYVDTIYIYIYIYRGRRCGIIPQLYIYQRDKASIVKMNENLHIYITVMHDVQFSCAINQPLLAHHWKVHQCLLTSRFIAPSIPWAVCAPGGKMRRQLLKDHNFLNNSPIFIIESSTFKIFAFQKALHTIDFNSENCFGFGERYLTP